MAYLSKNLTIILSFLILFSNPAFPSSDVKQAVNEAEEVIAAECKVDDDTKQKIIDADESFQKVTEAYHNGDYELTKEEYKNEILIRWGGGLYDYAKTRWLVDIINDMQYTAHNSLRYDFIEFLSEYHFDVFGLIPEGLAIDINTIK